MSQKPFSRRVHRPQIVHHSSNLFGEGGSSTAMSSRTSANAMISAMCFTAFGGQLLTDAALDCPLVIFPGIRFYPLQVRIAFKYDPRIRFGRLFLQPQPHFTVSEQASSSRHQQCVRISYKVNELSASAKRCGLHR